ncbi:hypothetical protein VTL71DRAFT_2427 [Oculimacula yallundae]|uniref:Uncharacterized protein n=1 Tax=Oculimacula yallundae TaxID=86028 RepID=A0ABR4C8W3_9HELO
MRFSRFVAPALVLLVGSTAAQEYEKEHGGSCAFPPDVYSVKPYPSATHSSVPTFTMSVAGTTSTVDVDLVVIGGGSGGIHAAIQLKDAGAKVIVIEKKKQIGGHAETYKAPNGTPINAGVVVFEDLPVVNNYFTRLNVNKTLFSFSTDTPPSTPPSTLFDFSLGIPIPAQNASAAQAQNLAIAAAVKSYSTNVLSKYPWIDNGFLVPSPVPAELLIPFSSLAKKYNFEALLPLIAQLNYYTGDVSAIPALYGIKGFGPGLLSSVFSKFIVPSSRDTRTLYEAAAKDLGDAVLLESTIVNVKREVKIAKHTTGVTVLVTQPGKAPTLIRAKKLLVAIPQTIKNIGTYDLSSEERSLFSKFSAIGYWAGVAKIPDLRNGVQNVGINTPYNQAPIPHCSMFQYNAGALDYFTAAVGFDTLNYTEASSQAIVRADLKRLEAAGGVPVGSAEKVTFPFSSDHGPFNLRVTPQEIGAGFYEKLIGFEGKRNTYWTGAAFASHDSALIWNYNMGTVVPGLKKDLEL